jgi:5-methylcytosine-specific restriction endonuclease McrA
MRYKVQFTADQTYVDLLEQARDLLKHQIPDRDLARVQRLAIEALLEKLTKRKYAATTASPAEIMTTMTRRDAPQTPTNVAAPEPTPRALAVKGHPVMATAAPDPDHAARTLSGAASHEAMPSARTPTPAAIVDGAQAAPTPHALLPSAPTSTPTGTSDAAQAAATTRPTTDPDQAMATPTRTTPRPDRQLPDRHIPGRHISAAVKRAVWQRDAGRCSYVDDRGQRCRETAGLEFHHRTPYVQGGAADADNITLHCRAHNGLAAERDFGRDFMERRKRG